jgi:hypothetical protein
MRDDAVDHTIRHLITSYTYAERQTESIKGAINQSINQPSPFQTQSIYPSIKSYYVCFNHDFLKHFIPNLSSLPFRLLSTYLSKKALCIRGASLEQYRGDDRQLCIHHGT